MKPIGTTGKLTRLHPYEQWALEVVGEDKVVVSHLGQSQRTTWGVDELIESYGGDADWVIEWDEPKPKAEVYVCKNCGHSWERHVDGDDDMVVCDCWCMSYEVKL